MPYGVLIGVMAGIANLIPYMGPIVGYGLTIVSGVISGETKTMIISIVIISVVQVLDGAVINPKLLSHSIEIHPLLVLVAIIAGEKVGGFAGMIVAVPFAALLKIWFDASLREGRNLEHVKRMPLQQRLWIEKAWKSNMV